MDKLVGLVSGAPKTRSQNDDDFADRLSSRYSVVILVVFAILVGMNQYVRNPMTCWAPVHFTKSHTAFATSYCWVKDTYYLPWDSAVPKEWERDKRQMIPYYQWVPFILLLQAILFYLPTLVWHGLNSRAGVDADNILSAAHTFTRTDRVENRERTMKMLVNQIDRFLDNRAKRFRCTCDGRCVKNCCNACGRRVSYYLLALFLFSKLCYIGNVIGQLFLLNVVLSTKYSTFGFDIAKDMASNRDWTEDSYVAFPRVTLCDFKIRGQDMANVHPYTVQCVLPINLYNEKIYMFLWFWMVFVAAASVISFIVWAVRAILVVDRIRFVKNHLQLGQPVEGDTVDGKIDDAKRITGNDDLIRKFTTKYLKQDGAFLLRLIAHNTNNITTTEVTWALWEVWREKKPSEEDGEGDDSETMLIKGRSKIEEPLTRPKFAEPSAPSPSGLSKEQEAHS